MRLSFFPLVPSLVLLSSDSPLFAVSRVHRAVSPGGVCRLLAGRPAQLPGGRSDGPGVSDLLLRL